MNVNLETRNGSSFERGSEENGVGMWGFYSRCRGGKWKERRRFSQQLYTVEHVKTTVVIK